MTTSESLLASIINDEDQLLPPYDDTTRRHSTIIVSIFNLSATIVGGGILSVPLAMSKCGILLGSLLMIISVVITDKSLYLMCLCARQTRTQTFGEVGKAAFGSYMESTISVILFIFLLFVLVAYMVLTKDIWTTIIEILLHKISVHRTVNPDLVLLATVLIMFPFLIRKNLYELRYNCYVGLTSVSILCFALCHHAYLNMTANDVDDRDAMQVLGSDVPVQEEALDDTTYTIKLWTSSFDDVLFAFPIITLAFLSIFNILPIQNSLIDPTVTRMKFVISGATTSCFTLTLLFGLGGYLYAQQDTNGNILLNVNSNGGTDILFFLGRLGCGVTIMLAMAMMLLPCRASLLEVLDMITNHPHIIPPPPQMVVSPSSSHEEGTPLLVQSTVVAQTPASSTSTQAYGTDGECIVKKSSPTAATTNTHGTLLEDDPWAHYGATIGIAALCYIIAIRVPGVAVVWSLCGSFLAFFIAFIYPAACYIQIQRKYPSTFGSTGRGGRDMDAAKTQKLNQTASWILFSWVILVFSVVGSIACTTKTVSQVFFSS